MFFNHAKGAERAAWPAAQSERYCATVASNPGLATQDTHILEVHREHRIAELSGRYGIDPNTQPIGN